MYTPDLVGTLTFREIWARIVLALITLGAASMGTDIQILKLLRRDGTILNLVVFVSERECPIGTKRLVK